MRFSVSTRAVAWVSAALLFIVLSSLGPAVPEAWAQTSATAFTYQGELEEDGRPVDVSSARMIFRLWTAESGGTQVGSDCMVYPVAIVEGVFTAAVDFGEYAFKESARWLEIGVDVNGGTAYTWLSPRHRVTASPTAIYALHGGDSPWVIYHSDIYYDEGRVGVGTSTPTYPLSVQSQGADVAIGGITSSATSAAAGVYGQASGASGQGVLGHNTSTTGTGRGVAGYSASPDGYGLHGSNGAATGRAVGVFGENESPTGWAIWGRSNSRTGNPKGVVGSASSPEGYGVYAWNEVDEGRPIGLCAGTDAEDGIAGYFFGGGYFRNRLGIGVEGPAEMLEVAGTGKFTGLQLTTSPQEGYVLTSDDYGVGTWRAPSGSGGIGGSGTPYYLPKFTSATTLGNSVIYESSGGNVGIGTTVPTQKLQVLGTVRMNGFQLSSSPTAGYVLTSDASGNGTWQEAGGETAWNDCTEGIFYNEGVVGIGTNSPGTLASLRVVTSSTYGIRADGGSYGIKGEGTDAGVVGTGGPRGVQGSGTAWGVDGTSTGGTGVRGASTNGIGVNAVSSGTTTSHPALYATNDNANGIAVFSTCTSTDANLVVVNKGAGDIIKGFSGSTGGDLVFRVANDGTTSVSVLQITGGSDLSEQFDVQSRDTEIRPGLVVCIDPEEPGRLAVSRHAYDRTVAGVISGAGGVVPGMTMGQRGSIADGGQPVALTGRVYVWADATHGAIRAGDLLTTSDTPGHAMKVADHGRAQGAILGKAMSSLDEGTGLVLVLVSLQ